MGQPQLPPEVPLPDAPRARHLGDLARGETRWSVYLESIAQGGSARGRVHFVSGARHRITGWIFLEWSEQAVYDRFGEFSPAELWKLVESLG
jgi:hypothetical protein